MTLDGAHVDRDPPKIAVIQTALPSEHYLKQTSSYDAQFSDVQLPDEIGLPSKVNLSGQHTIDNRPIQAR